MVNKCHTVDTTLVSVSENNVDITLPEFLDEIILAGRTCKSVGNLPSGRSYVNFIFGTLEAAFDGCATYKLAETRCLERRCDYLAVIICCEIYQTMILTTVYTSVGLLTFHII